MRMDRANAGIQQLETLEPRRLMAFGALNTDFGVAGVSDVDGALAPAQQVIDAAGKIIVGGNGRVVRLTASGSLDTSFGSGGKISLPGATVRDFAVDDSGRLYTLVNASSGTVVLRYTAVGQTDRSFGLNGAARVSVSTSFFPARLALQSDGKILVAGTFKTDNGSGRRVRVYRLKTDGNGDATFGSSGTTEFNFATENFLTPVRFDAITALRALPNGKIELAGGGVDYAPEIYDSESGSYIAAAYGSAVFGVARLNSTGVTDSNFAADGVSRMEYAGASEIFTRSIQDVLPTAGAIGTDGSAIVAARVTENIAQRFDSAGAASGRSAPGALSAFSAVLNALALPDGRNVVIGPAATSSVSRGYALAYIYSDGGASNTVFTAGDRDQTFVGFGGPTAGLAVSNDGDLLVAGQAANDAGTFRVAKIDAGKLSDKRPDNFANARASDIAQDNLGRLHLAYYDAATTTLKYAMRDANGLWGKTQTIDGSANAGQYVAIDVDSNGNPGIAYFDGTNGDLKLALSDQSSWTIRSVETKGSVGLYPSLDFDDTNRPTMTYYKKTGGDLRFARFDPAANVFSYETVDSDNDVGRSSVLVASPKTRRYSIAYTDTTTGDVKWAGRKKGGVGWTIKTAASTSGGADFLSMAYGYYYEPAISYYDAGAADLQLTYFDANQQKFLKRTLATSGATGLYSQTVFNSYYDQPLVFAYNRTADAVTRYNGGTISGTPLAATAVNGGGRYLSVDFTQGQLAASYYDADDGVLKVRGLSVA